MNQTEYLSGGAGWRARIPERPPACLAVEPLEARGIMSHSRLPHRQQGTLPSAATVAPYTAGMAVPCVQLAMEVHCPAQSPVMHEQRVET